MRATLVLAAVLPLAVLLLSGCGRSSFDTESPDGRPLTPLSVAAVLEDGGLAVEKVPVEFEGLPGLVDSLFLRVAAADDPGETAEVLVMQFDTESARDEAIDHELWRPFERPIVHTWTWGPLVIVVEGDRDWGVVTDVDDALRAAGAR